MLTSVIVHNININKKSAINIQTTATLMFLTNGSVGMLYIKNI